MLLTEEQIRQRLQAGAGAGTQGPPGYAEIDVTEDTPLRCAAVLIPLVRQTDDWSILYTRRTDLVESHKGQVSFPGGACDDGETTPEETALREAQEEIGVDPSSVHLLGRLATFVTITTYSVTPVVGVLHWPTVFRLGKEEVERIFTIPVQWLAEPGNRWEFQFPGTKRSIIAFHPYDGELLWGATARMTVDFLRVLGL